MDSGQPLRGFRNDGKSFYVPLREGSKKTPERHPVPAL
jgi:hypothetical protein